jgi:hypothetical protein
MRGAPPTRSYPPPLATLQGRAYATDACAGRRARGSAGGAPGGGGARGGGGGADAAAPDGCANKLFKIDFSSVFVALERPAPKPPAPASAPSIRSLEPNFNPPPPAPTAISPPRERAATSSRSREEGGDLLERMRMAMTSFNKEYSVQNPPPPPDRKGLTALGE